MRVWRLPLSALLTLFVVLGVGNAQTRQSGLLFLTPPLQAMQRDPDTNPISLWPTDGMGKYFHGVI